MEDAALPVTGIDRTPIELPFRDVPGRNMARELPHWQYFEVIEVEVAGAHVGYGETMLFYRSGETTAADVEHARGENAVDLLWDDSLGPGFQMALFDAVGRALDVPVSRLLGERVHDRVPVAWWCIDMPAADWVAEAETALDRGYTHFKLKARPSFDLKAQLDALADVLPPAASIGLDFNATLRDFDRGESVLDDAVSYPFVDVIESPVCIQPPSDEATVADCRTIARAYDADHVLHYGGDLARTLGDSLCDGFVLTDRAAAGLARQGAVATEAGLPSFLQYAGTGITTSFALHLASTIEAATYPAVTCQEIYEPTTLADPIPVANGTTPVPDGPGLGHAVDTDVIERYATDRPSEQPSPDRLIETRWPDGRRLYVAGGEHSQTVIARSTDLMPFERGVETRLVPETESETWRDLLDRAREEPIMIGPDDASPL